MSLNFSSSFTLSYFFYPSIKFYERAISLNCLLIVYNDKNIRDFDFRRKNVSKRAVNEINSYLMLDLPLDKIGLIIIRLIIQNMKKNTISNRISPFFYAMEEN